MNPADRNKEPIELFRLDGYTISKDLLHNIVFILLLSVSCMLFAFTYSQMTYAKTYTMTTTFTVMSSGTKNDVYTNMSNAYETANNFTTILNSSKIQGAVAKASGMDLMPGVVTATVVENTNLMTLSVTEDSPQLAFTVMKAILENYDQVSDKLMGDVTLHILSRSDIPQSPDASFAPASLMLKTFVISLFLIVIIMVFASAFRDTIRREVEVEKKLDSKRLGTLYHENKYLTLKSRIKKKKGGILVSNPSVSFRYSESIKKLAARIKRKMDHKNAKVLMVTSVLENEGKSTVAANIALALMDESAKVLLIDGDFRKPALYKIFDIAPDKINDFGDVLSKKEVKDNTVVKHTKSGLDILFNTMAYSGSTELISQGLFADLIERLKKEFDYIIVDSSPMALVADSEEMLSVVDSVLLIVRQHKALASDINDSIDIINRRKIKLIGCVFNDVGGDIGNRLSIGYGESYGSYNKYNAYSGYGRYYDYDKSKINEEGDES